MEENKDYILWDEEWTCECGQVNHLEMNLPPKFETVVVMCENGQCNKQHIHGKPNATEETSGQISDDIAAQLEA